MRLETAPRACIRVDSPVGELCIEADAQAVRVVGFVKRGETKRARDRDAAVAPASARRLAERCARELAEYFRGERRDFRVPVAPSGTPFQERVWAALRRIPFGETVSYGAIARAIGAPTASRAVGGANNKNPIAIVIPCHRVIGADARMVGYGGGLDKKRWLLQHEAQPTQAKRTPDRALMARATAAR